MLTVEFCKKAQLETENALFLTVGAAFAQIGAYTQAMQFAEKTLRIATELGDKTSAVRAKIHILLGHVLNKDKDIEALEEELDCIRRDVGHLKNTELIGKLEYVRSKIEVWHNQ